MTFTNPALSHEGLGDIANHGLNVILIVIAMVIGTAIAVPAARLVKMTAMPQMVAIFNGVGGGAAALVSVTELLKFPSSDVAVYKIGEVLFGVLVGAVSFSGSAIAFAKLQELVTGRPITYPGQQQVNAVLGVVILGVAVAALVTGHVVYVYVLLLLSLVLGAAFVLPIGGADVPVLISLLNSFTGLAVAASGFTLDNNLLIVAGTLVGASGILLTTHDELGDGQVATEHPVQRVRVRDHRGCRGSRPPQDDPFEAVPPTTSEFCSHTRGRWPSSPGTASPSLRPSTQ